jgi:hypothetical protein
MRRWSAFADEVVDVGILRQQQIRKADTLALARFADAQEDQVLPEPFTVLDPPTMFRSRAKVLIALGVVVIPRNAVII